MYSTNLANVNIAISSQACTPRQSSQITVVRGTHCSFWFEKLRFCFATYVQLIEASLVKTVRIFDFFFYHMGICGPPRPGRFGRLFLGSKFQIESLPKQHDNMTTAVQSTNSLMIYFFADKNDLHLYPIALTGIILRHPEDTWLMVWQRRHAKQEQPLYPNPPNLPDDR